MSLLLDALKKAAEQKARKSESSEADADGKADETLLDIAADVGARAQPEESVSGEGFGDETELDHSELSARLERSNVVRGSADETALDLAESTDTRAEAGRASVQEPRADETGLEIPDATQTAYQPTPAADDERDDTALKIPESTETRLSADTPQREAGDETAINLPADSTQTSVSDDAVLSQQLQTGDDETMFFTTDDETDLSQMGGDELTGIGVGSGDVRDADDETDLSRLGGEELTGIHENSVAETMRREREQAEKERETELWEKDETGIDMPEEDPTTAGVREINDDDETVLAEPFAEPVASDAPSTAADADSTDYSHPARRADQVEPADASPYAGRDSGEGGEDETLEPGRSTDDIQDEDLSLLLIEPDPTKPPETISSFSDPQAAAERQRALQAAGELSLEDTTQSRGLRDQTDTQSETITNPAQLTASVGDDTRMAQGDSDTISNVSPVDATSTLTYAPDNYDRTLMKLPSDDESKLFAGMKSDSDVIMTPDYAKKVFRSKTSAQRMQHYKIYGGIGIALLLAIGIYGGIQYQEESYAIDASLMPLKRDPLPGVIKPKTEEENNLFASSDSEATARTIKIIQTAEVSDDAVAADTAALDAVDDTDAAADEVESATVEMAQVDPEPTETEVSSEPEPAEQVVVVATAQQPAAEVAPEPQSQDDGGEIAMLSSSAPEQASADEPTEQSASNLQIQSSDQYDQNDILLRDAYEAYLAGNDEQALKLYNQVLKTDPANRNALLARAAINAQNGNADAAVQDYQALLLINPKDSLAMSSLLAVAEYSPLEVESQLKLMIRDEPNSPYLNFALANAYGAQNRWLEAQRHYFTALENNPQDPNYAYNLAVSLEHISQPASAADYYQRALENIENGLATFSPEVVNQRLAVLGKP